MVGPPVGANRSDAERDVAPGSDVVGESQVEVLGKLGDRQVTGKCCAHELIS